MNREIVIAKLKRECATHVAYLLLEHPCSLKHGCDSQYHSCYHVFFPLAIHPEETTIHTDSYFMFPYYLQKQDGDVKIEASNLSSLLKRGRIEAINGLENYTQSVSVLGKYKDSEQDLLLVRSDNRNIKKMSKKWKVNLLADINTYAVRWEQDVDKTIEGSADISEIIEHYTDQNPDPPYYPFTYMNVSAPYLSNTASAINALGWNCFFLSSLGKGELGHIKNIPSIHDAVKKTEWYEDLKKSDYYSNFTEDVKEFVNKTVDLVQIKCKFMINNKEWWLVARHNKLRETQVSNGENYYWKIAAEVGRQDVNKNVQINQIIREALTIVPDDDDAIITIWIIPNNGEGGSDEKPLLVGIKPGAKIGEIPDNALLGKKFIYKSDDITLTMKHLINIDETEVKKHADNALMQIKKAINQTNPLDRMWSLTKEWFEGNDNSVYEKGMLPHQYIKDKKHKAIVKKVWPWFPDSWLDNENSSKNLHECLKTLCGKHAFCSSCGGKYELTVGAAYLLLLMAIECESPGSLAEKNLIADSTWVDHNESSKTILPHQAHELAKETVNALFALFRYLIITPEEGKRTLNVENIIFEAPGQGFTASLAWDSKGGLNKEAADVVIKGGEFSPVIPSAKGTTVGAWYRYLLLSQLSSNGFGCKHGIWMEGRELKVGYFEQKKVKT